MRKFRNGLLFQIGLLWSLVTLLFLLFRLLGDPSRMIAGQRSDAGTLASIRKQYHLDDPIGIQYLSYLNDLSPISINGIHHKPSVPFTWIIKLKSRGVMIKYPDLGFSFQTRRPVIYLILERLPGTLILAVSSMVLALGIGIPSGIIAALSFGRWPDRILSVIAMLGVSAPSFVVAIGLIWAFAIYLGSNTGLPMTGFLWEADLWTQGYIWNFSTLILPTLALGLRPLSVILQLTRSSMLEVLTLDYIRTAKAKGVNYFTIIFFHALPNALNPVITAASGWFAALLSGVFFIELLFDWQGLGKLTVGALQQSDFPLLMGCVLTVGIIFMVIQQGTDVLNYALDPRQRKN
jgi:peptide/nickel transport system permease protein